MTPYNPFFAFLITLPNHKHFSKSSSIVYISTVLGLLLPEFTCSTISHSFGSGPIMSGTFSLTFSKVLSVAISCGIFFCFRSSCR